MGTYTFPSSCSRTFSTDGTLKVISSSWLGPSRSPTRCLWSSCSGAGSGVCLQSGADGAGCGGREAFWQGPSSTQSSGLLLGWQEMLTAWWWALLLLPGTWTVLCLGSSTWKGPSIFPCLVASGWYHRAQPGSLKEPCLLLL